MHRPRAPVLHVSVASLTRSLPSPLGSSASTSILLAMSMGWSSNRVQDANGGPVIRDRGALVITQPVLCQEQFILFKS